MIDIEDKDMKLELEKEGKGYYENTLQKCGENTETKVILRDLQDGRGVRRGDHLPPHKYIRNSSTCGTTPIEHLLTERWQKTSDCPKGKKVPTYLGRAKEKSNSFTCFQFIQQPKIKASPEVVRVELQTPQIQQEARSSH